MSAQTHRSELTTTGQRITARNFGWHHADRQTPAISGLDLVIQPGEKVLLLGPSGAGKSTLLHALAGVLQTDETQQPQGELLIGDNSAFERIHPVGLMQQDPETQIVQSRVDDDVAFGAENLGVDPAEIRARIPRALDAVGLGMLAPEHRTQELSGGQKQRLALAGILAMEPSVILLDEPTANIDPQSIPPLREAVMRVVEASSATLVVVEHRLEQWARYMDRILVLQPGGGLAHDLSYDQLMHDQRIRTELADAGIWVPGYVPATPALHATPGAALLNASGLSAERHAGAPRTQPLDLSIDSGTALALRGPNGAGKSTLALTLSGLLPPAGGQLTASGSLAQGLAGEPYTWKAGALVSRIGSVFQEPEHQFVTGTVRDELAYAPRRAQRSSGAERFTDDQIEHRVQELLDRLGLADLADANPFTLSGGEKRRLSVATVLAASPKVVVLDEPTFGQDANTWAQLAALLIEELNRGAAVIAVTHDEQFADVLGAHQVQVQPAAEQSAARAASTPSLDAPVPESWLAKINPLAKVGAVAASTLPLITTLDWVSATVVVAATLLALPLAGLSLGGFLRRAWPLLVAALTAAWGIMLVGQDSGAVVLDWGILSITEGSVAGGIATGLRALALAVPAVLLLSTTNPSDLGGALSQQLKLPHRFVLGVLGGMRLLGLLVEEFTTLTLARRARGVGDFASPWQRLKAAFGQVLALLVQAIRRAGRLSVTMEAKGFGAAKRTWLRRAVFTATDAAVLAAGVLVGAGALAAALLAGTYNLVW